MKNHCRPLTLRGHDSNAIRVSGGGWNNVHAELTQRTLVDGDFFEITGDGQLQNGVGICIDSPEISADPQIRGHHDCVGFYGDGSVMFETDKDGNEQHIMVNRRIASKQGFTYYQNENAVIHSNQQDNKLIDLPEHFRNKPLRAIAQVWNSNTAYLTQATLKCEQSNEGYPRNYDGDEYPSDMYFTGDDAEYHDRITDNESMDSWPIYSYFASFFGPVQKFVLTLLIEMALLYAGYEFIEYMTGAILPFTGFTEIQQDTSSFWNFGNKEEETSSFWNFGNKEEEYSSPFNYTRFQGICRPDQLISQKRYSDRNSCMKSCDQTPSCQAFLVGEGAAHMYTGTCELYSGSASSADKNGGWSCYSR